MTQEEKNLLLKDLCARLPYNTMVHGVYAHQNQDFDTESDYITYKEMDNMLTVLDIEWIQMCAAEVKPYLFPLSSMTEEQKEEHKDLLDNQYSFDANGNIFTLQDFYCKYHLDFRGLIPMGLAIDATNLNIY
jgi:hypothetical protein